MFDNLTGLGYGLVTFAIIIGVGVVVLQGFAGAVDNCSVHTTLSPGATYNVSTGVCSNLTVGDVGAASQGTQNLFYMEGQMGSSGLAGWTPAIIALSVGMLFLGVFLSRGGRKV